MKVLLTHPSAEMYGSDRMAAEAAGGLVAAGHDVQVVLPTPGPLEEHLAAVGVSTRIEDVPVLRKGDMKPTGLARLVGRLGHGMAGMRRVLATEAPDVVYVNTIVQPWWVALARAQRLPVVVHVREAESQLPRPVRSCLLSPLLLATSIACNSQATMSEIARTLPKLDPRKMRVVYNGKDWDSYDTAARPQERSGVFSIVVIGRLSPRKGQDIVLHALAELERLGVHARLTLVGDVFPGYEWFEAKLRDTARDLGIADRVLFSGFSADIRPYLQDSDVAVVPSRIEPFGTVAAESMAARVLTIVADVQGLTEIVTHDETGLVFPGEDAAALALRLLWVIRNAGAARDLALAGQASVRERFTVSGYRAEIVDLIEAAVRQGGN